MQHSRNCVKMSIKYQKSTQHFHQILPTVNTKRICTKQHSITWHGTAPHSTADAKLHSNVVANIECGRMRMETCCMAFSLQCKANYNKIPKMHTHTHTNTNAGARIRMHKNNTESVEMQNNMQSEMFEQRQYDRSVVLGSLAVCLDTFSR